MEIQHIDTEVLSSRRHEVQVLRVESPLLMWVRFRAREADLVNLLADLEINVARGGREIILWPHQVTDGVLVAARYRRQWQRGVVTHINQDRGRALISLGDWGRKIWVPYQGLRTLGAQYHQLPWQAVACGLAHTGPSIPSDRWPSKTRALCRLIAEGEDGWVRFRYPVRPGVAHVDLEITRHGDHRRSFCLREALTNLGHVREERHITVDTFPAI